jgi:hypothetical protein
MSGFSFRAFAGWAARNGQSWRMGWRLRTVSSAAPAAPAVAIAPELLLVCRVYASDFRSSLMFLRFGLGFRLSLEFRLFAGVTFGFWELGLQRSGAFLRWFIGLLLAPLAAVAHPSAHAALVTRLVSG